METLSMALLSTLGTALLFSSAVSSTVPCSLQQPGPEVAGPQQAGPKAPSRADLPWSPSTELELRLSDRYGNFNVAVVGEEIITRFDLFSWMEGTRFEDPTAGRKDLRPDQRHGMQISAALTQLIEQRLKVQGGRSQGYDEELIEQQRERYFRSRIDQLGGPQSAASTFEAWGVTPEEYKNILGEGVMANLWERSVTGLDPGATGRVYVDAYVRPGQMWARYREYSESPNQSDNDIVGRTRNGKLTVQRLVLLVNPGGESAEEVKGKLGTLREKISSGVLTFDEGIQSFAAPSMQGDESIVRDARPGALVQLFQNDFTSQADEVKGFLLKGKPGDLSPVLEFDDGGKPQAYVLLKIVARTDATPAAPFEGLELQTRLREAIAKEASEVRVARGLADLVRTTHLAPEELRSSFLSRGRRRRGE